jgi:hypothetical protein
VYEDLNGNNFHFWLSRCFWVVYQSAVELTNSNLLKLAKFAHHQGYSLAPDQASEVYQKILFIVQDAARTPAGVNWRGKQSQREEFEVQIKEIIQLANHPTNGIKGNQLEKKMVAANLPEDYITDAQELRRNHLKMIRSGGYLELNRREEIEAQARTTLLQLKTDLDTEDIPDSGLEFFKKCINK